MQMQCNTLCSYLNSLLPASIASSPPLSSARATAPPRMMMSAGAAAGFADHVAQRSRRDKLRFPPPTHHAMALLPPPPPDHDINAPNQLAYLHAPTWPRAKLEHHDDAAQFTTLLQQQAALALTLSPAYQGSLQSVVVLTGSRFLRPAQQLLDDICAALLPEGTIEGASGGVGSFSLLQPAAERLDGHGREHRRPEFREEKAKLLYMQEEVCKRYRHYRQQMQTVVSSFESIPGLSSATPYASSVLKAIYRHFRCLRMVISRQIQYMNRLLGEELLSLPGSITEHHQKSQQPAVWKPHRGHSERAVTVLRAWLFDNFLQPYPSDEDKQMLATRTGLSRNQVSNWFINARVRLWKPMVEEMYKLETRSSAAAAGSTNCTPLDTSGAAMSSDTARTLPPPPAMAGGHHQMMEEECMDHAPPPTTCLSGY
ncbi:BEL1-like homeodomain protein 8 [Phragmites australis]|uniref:BEL1-like homeodomain protein 8 n=1 Tax=Phragmites australis TaxID=29695 RepID=UPI002D769DBE|nr:BEL1-like homeodomain protein 8 [Phragmites australis]